MEYLCPQVPGGRGAESKPGCERKEFISVPQAGTNVFLLFFLQPHLAAALNSSVRSAQGFCWRRENPLSAECFLLWAVQGAGTCRISILRLPRAAACPPQPSHLLLCPSVLPGRTTPAARPTPAQKSTRTNPACTTSTGTIVG